MSPFIVSPILMFVEPVHLHFICAGSPGRPLKHFNIGFRKTTALSTSEVLCIQLQKIHSAERNTCEATSVSHLLQETGAELTVITSSPVIVTWPEPWTRQHPNHTSMSRHFQMSRTRDKVCSVNVSTTVSYVTVKESSKPDPSVNVRLQYLCSLAELSTCKQNINLDFQHYFVPCKI